MTDVVTETVIFISLPVSTSLPIDLRHALREFDTPVYKGKASYITGLFINGQFIDGSNGTTIDVVNPTNGKLITSVSEGTAKDVDAAVEAAQRAFDTVWGLNAPGNQRSKLLGKLARLLEVHADEIAALEALDNGKTFYWVKNADLVYAIECIHYFAGWADKISDQVQETSEAKLTYTRHEPLGVVGQIIPWNATTLMMALKLAPALATGNTVVLKPSEIAPLCAIRIAHLVNEAGFPPGVVNIVTGYGGTVGEAITNHMGIEKISFTGSTQIGRRIMEVSGKSNLKEVTLELGGKSPNIVFDDADLEQALKWAVFGIFFHQGQMCVAGSRIFVQEGIYDEFLKRFIEQARSLKVGDPFSPETFYGPQVSQAQFDRIMDYIESGKQAGAKLEIGGHRLGNEGYFISPTVFTGTSSDMKIVKEKIFGPVAVIVKFRDEEDAIRQANDTTYGLAAAVFTQNLNRALKTVNKLKAGTTWVNCISEMGEYVLRSYTAVKAVHINLDIKL